MSKMSQQEKSEWHELYEYVRSEIMLYDKAQSLSKNMILRLKGLANGKLYANNKIADNAQYSYGVILITFKYCYKKIMTAISVKSFDTEIKKFNYICAIVENNINDVYIKLKRNIKSESKVNDINVDSLNHQSASYKRKTVDVAANLESLW